METADLLKKVRKIEIKTRGLSQHLFSGEYHSAFKGRGMSFSEVRAYQYGDDVRTIDWNVTARTGSPFIKVFEEERELTVMLAVDISRSAYFGTANQFKNELMAEICAVLAFSAINNNDKVGVIFFSDRIEKFIPPKKGKSHILLIIRELLNIEPVGKMTNIAAGLEYLNSTIKKRSIVFLMSDFMSQGFDHALKIAAKRHDIIGLHIADPAEMQLPDIGLTKVLDAESGASFWLDTTDKNIRFKYANWFHDNLARCKNNFLKSGADLLSIKTTENYAPVLLRFFQQRHRN